MDEVQKKVLLDLFVSPWTVGPIVGGMSAWLLSWGMNGDPRLNIIGLAGVLAGLGIQASRLVFGLEKITEQAHGYLTEKERAEREAQLNELAEKLSHDDDPRTQECLNRLRILYKSFEEESATGHAAITIREKVDKLFHAAVKQLVRSYELWEKAKRLPGQTGRPLLEKRRDAVNEVVLTVNHLARTVEQYHAFQLKDSDDELAKLREELDTTIEVARRADDRIESMDMPSIYDQAEYQE